MQLRTMTAADVDEVLAVEQQIHSHPWTRGNFNDALASGYQCKIYEQDKEIVGYAILMPALDELQLLDIGIARAQQGKGLGKRMLQELISLAHAQNFKRMLLEVRQSNAAARALYVKTGFTQIGLRRGYYPLAGGREDAIVMEYQLE
jgi:ribosomal-protein-alanine N-acetyltransferase